MAKAALQDAIQEHRSGNATDREVSEALDACRGAGLPRAELEALIQKADPTGDAVHIKETEVQTVHVRHRHPKGVAASAHPRVKTHVQVHYVDAP